VLAKCSAGAVCTSYHRVATVHATATSAAMAVLHILQVHLCLLMLLSILGRSKSMQSACACCYSFAYAYCVIWHYCSSAYTRCSVQAACVQMQCGESSSSCAVTTTVLYYCLNAHTERVLLQRPRCLTGISVVHECDTQQRIVTPHLVARAVYICTMCTEHVVLIVVPSLSILQGRLRCLSTNANVKQSPLMLIS
jgi:hypothetical protein